MTDRRMEPAGRELGLDFLQFHISGRAGVLARAPAEVAVGPGPWREATPYQQKWKRAERMTDSLAAPAYAALRPSERVELVDLLDELKAAARLSGA